MHIQVTHPAGTNMQICITFFATKLAVSRKLTLISATSISNGMVYVFVKFINLISSPYCTISIDSAVTRHKARGLGRIPSPVPSHSPPG